jgi:hypothetical protein
VSSEPEAGHNEIKAHTFSIKATAREPINRPDTYQRLPLCGASLAKCSGSIQQSLAMKLDRTLVASSSSRRLRLLRGRFSQAQNPPARHRAPLTSVSIASSMLGAGRMTDELRRRKARRFDKPPHGRCEPLLKKARQRSQQHDT